MEKELYEQGLRAALPDTRQSGGEVGWAGRFENIVS
jgi:hypothetical protein